MYKMILILGLMFFPTVGVSDVTYKEVEIITDTEDKNEAIRLAADQVSREFIKNLMGEKKYNKHQKQIENKIVTNRNRYILITRTKPPVAQEDGKFMTKVSLGFSQKNLKAVLLENNLYYSSVKALCLLPVIYFKVEKEDYAWWKHPLQTKKSQTRIVARHFYQNLSSHLVKSGFYVIDPILSRTYEGTPSSELPSGKRVSQFIKLADFLNCNLIMSGTVTLNAINNKPVFPAKKSPSPSNVSTADSPSHSGEFSFKLFNTHTKALLFELKKQIPPVNLKEGFRAEMEMLFRSLNYQLSAYKESGSLELNRLFLSVQGLSKHYEKEKLRQALIKNIPPIKDLKERIITSQQITYEMDSSRDIASLINFFDSNKIPQFSVQIVDYDKKKIDIYAQPNQKK